ncbi:MAG: 2OG-Fe(II) oxygenase [Chloroflexota bacterium]|nr:2OG-Fe(II) oxygenase [Chloroflexota bacterium]
MDRGVLQLDAVSRSRLEQVPFSHAVVDGLFRPNDAAALAANFPTDHYRVVNGRDEKVYRYDARPFIRFGTSEVRFPERLSPEWRALGADLGSAAYRRALGTLVGLDLQDLPVEVNLFHYGPRSLLDPHPDLPDKVVTHVLYFNDSWDREDGGCLRILRSSDDADFAKEILPLVGSSAVLVRSDNSWHSVPAVRPDVDRSRRSMTVTFYRPGSSSIIFPADRDYHLVDVTPKGSRPVDRVVDLVLRLTRKVQRSVRRPRG